MPGNDLLLAQDVLHKQDKIINSRNKKAAVNMNVNETDDEVDATMANAKTTEAPFKFKSRNQTRNLDKPPNMSPTIQHGRNHSDWQQYLDELEKRFPAENPDVNELDERNVPNAKADLRRRQIEEESFSD